MRTDKSYMIVISHFKLYPALFPLKWLICIPNISAVRGNVVFETLHDFYRTAINKNEIITILVCMFTHGYPGDPKNPPSLLRRRGRRYEDYSLHYLICQPAALAMRLGISVLSIRPVNISAPAPMAKQGT